MYKHIDAKYIKPCLLRENKFKDPKIIETFETLTNRDALEFVKRNPTQFSGLGGSKTMAELAVMGSSSANIMNKSGSTMLTRLVFIGSRFQGPLYLICFKISDLLKFRIKQ